MENINELILGTMNAFDGDLPISAAPARGRKGIIFRCGPVGVFIALSPQKYRATVWREGEETSRASLLFDGTGHEFEAVIGPVAGLPWFIEKVGEAMHPASA